MNRPRIGIIGTSWFADAVHLPLFSTNPECEVVSLCGRNEDRTNEMAGKYKIPKVYTDYRTMLRDGALDGVVIAAPDDMHHEMAMEAISNRIHLFCEKPMALTVAQAGEMRDAAKSAGLITLVNHTWRWMPAYQLARQLLDDGTLGELRRVGFQYRAGYASSSQYLWRFDAERANGALGDLGSHMVDLAHYLVSEITDVSARLGTYEPISRDTPGAPSDITPANDVAALLVGFANGAMGTIEVSAADFVSGFRNQHVELHGSQGSLLIELWDDGASVRCIRDDDRTEESLELPDEDEYFATALAGPRLFVKCLMGEAIPAPTFEDGYRTQRVIEAALESHSGGQRVSVPQ